MELNPKTCKHDRKTLCGIVKNLGNCPFPTIEHCNDNNATNLFGMQHISFGSITLKRYNFNHLKVKLAVLEQNMCQGCRVIWATPQEKCPICDVE